MNDMKRLNDPASVGFTIVMILLLLLVHSIYHVGHTILISDEVVTDKRMWLLKIKKVERMLLVIPSVILILLGMCVMKFIQYVQLAYGHFAMQSLLYSITVITILIWFIYEEKMRSVCLSWLNNKLTAKSMKMRSPYSSALPLAYKTFSAEKVFGEKTAREVMTPRMDMICLDQSKSFQYNISIAIHEMRTRYPVVNSNKDDIIGFIHIKDLLAIYDDVASRAHWQKAIRAIITVPESINVSNLLTMMQQQKTQIALLIDEYGGTSGMVTMEDIIEEIIGDIQDEFDQEENTIMKVKEDEYIVSSMLLIEEFNSYFCVQLEEDEMDSIGGFMYANIQFPPYVGQRVIYQYGDAQFVFTILKLEQLRITSIQVNREAISAIPSIQSL